MGRIKRVVIPGCPMHITHRGNNRSPIFRDDEDRKVCFDFLQRARLKAECKVHSYMFMGNHIHLLVTPESELGPAQMMQSVGSLFARHFNRRYGRTGAFWQGRYHSSLIQSSKYFFNCSRYIELNPVRALMVDRPEHHVWSSYHCNAGGTPDELITPHPMYSDLAKNDGDRRTAYRAMFAHSIDPEIMETIRVGAQRCDITGDAAFRDEVRRMTRFPDEPGS